MMIKLYVDNEQHFLKGSLRTLFTYINQQNITEVVHLIMDIQINRTQLICLVRPEPGFDPIALPIMLTLHQNVFIRPPL